MTFDELNVGDVFRAAGEEKKLWRKSAPNRANVLGVSWNTVGTYAFEGKVLEVVEAAPTSEIRRVDELLVLRDGEVILRHQAAWTVYRCVPGNPVTEIVLNGESFGTSRAERPTADTALVFEIKRGSKHLGRPTGSELIAYQGRVYGRATHKDLTGQAKSGSYYLVKFIGGEKRMTVAGLLGIPHEFALYDIIMEHFGPDATRIEEPLG